MFIENAYREVSMICKNCNKENIEGRKYCFYCGYDLTRIQEKIQKEEPVDTSENENNEHVKKAQSQSETTKKGINGKIIALISIVSVAVISVAIAVIVVSIPQNTVITSRLEQEELLSEISEEYQNETKQQVTNNVQEYANINNKSNILDEQSLNDIQRVLSNKSSDLNMNVKMIVDDVGSNEIQEYADINCKKECNSNGILFVKGLSNQSFAVSSIGNGNDYLPKNLKEKIIKEAKSNFSSMNLNEALSIAVNTIPNNKADASLYTFDMITNSNQVVYADSKKSKLTLIDWSNESPKKLFETNTVYFGMDGITDSPSEYKSATPKGKFKLGFAFSNHSLNTGLETLTVTSDMVWVDDPSSDYYNTVQYGPANNPPKWSSAEDTYAIFNGGTNYACILIEHNGDGYTKGISGKGSAMYLAGKNTNLTRSYGDVNISADDMKSLLSFLDESENPYIVIS